MLSLTQYFRDIFHPTTGENMHFEKCPQCNGNLLDSNRYCPFCGRKNAGAVQYKEADMNLQIAAETYPGDRQELFRDEPCVPARHENIVSSLKEAAKVDAGAGDLLAVMNHCPDCGAKLPK